MSDNFFYLPLSPDCMVHDGLLRLRTNRTLDPAYYEQRAHEIGVEAETLVKSALGPNLLRKVGAVQNPDVPISCYFPSELEFGIGLGDSQRHNAVENPEVYRTIRKYERMNQQAFRRMWFYRAIFQALLERSGMLPNPKMAFDKMKSRGEIIVNNRTYKVFANYEIGMGFYWEIEWPDRLSVDFTVELPNTERE